MCIWKQITKNVWINITADFIAVMISVNGTGKWRGVEGQNTFFATKTSFNQYAVAIFFLSSNACVRSVQNSKRNGTYELEKVLKILTIEEIKR